MKLNKTFSSMLKNIKNIDEFYTARIREEFSRANGKIDDMGESGKNLVNYFATKAIDKIESVQDVMHDLTDFTKIGPRKQFDYVYKISRGIRLDFIEARQTVNKSRASK